MTARPESSLRRGLEFAQSLVMLAAVLVACSPAPSANTLDLAWRTRLDGAVDGTPAIVGTTVFAGSAGGELAALDLRTGATIWIRRGLGPISDSPAVEGGRVYAGTLTGHVMAFGVSDGQTVWDWTGPPHAAIWSSPVVYRGLVLIGVASPYGDTPLVPGRMVALDAQTGVERWNRCVLGDCSPGDGVWSTVAIDDAGIAFVGIGNPDDGVLIFDPLTGRQASFDTLYPDDGRDLDVGARPVIVNAGGRELAVVATVAGLLVAVDPATNLDAWSRELVKGSAVHGLLATPAFDGTKLYVPSASPPTGVFAVRPADGTVLWRYGTAQPVYSAPATGEGVVVFGTGAVFGDLSVGSVTELSTAGRELGRYDAHAAVRGGPAIAGELVVVGDYAGDVLALKLRSA